METVTLEGVANCCCIFVKEKNKIVLFYEGVVSKAELTRELRRRLPRYMLPNAVIQVCPMPRTANGKMDRVKMQEIYQERRMKQ